MIITRIRMLANSFVRLSTAVLLFLFIDAMPVLAHVVNSSSTHFHRHALATPTGLFISPDPFGHFGSLDLHSYANQDGINWTDPTGRFGKAAVNTVTNIAGSPQFQGGMKIGGGVGLMFVGAGAVLTPEPTMLSKAGGIAGIGVGADFAATGWNQMWGKPSQTLTAQALAAGVQGAGFQPGTANRIAESTQSGIEMILPFGVVGKAAALGSATGKSGTKALSNAAPTWPSPGAGRQVIGGIEYTTHALERMAPKGLIQKGTEIVSRGVPTSVVENAIRYGKVSPGNTSAEVVRTYENVKVVTNPEGTRVITVIKTGE